MEANSSINWSHRSAVALASREGSDPIAAIQSAARKLVLRARENGWDGPPFNPVKIAELLGAQLSPNSSISDARLIEVNGRAVIEFNPQQPRERVRFSIAHEVAHLLFPDWSDEVRNRSAAPIAADEWQLEMLCNLAASEFVLPIGSLSSSTVLNSIESLMEARRKYDVSAEAFLIRLAKVSSTAVTVFFASPFEDDSGTRQYRIDYSVSSAAAPKVKKDRKIVPNESILRNCTAIGYTDAAVESWFSGIDANIEYVGIPGYPGSIYPRVAGIVRHRLAPQELASIRFVHGDILDLRGSGPKIVCQLVNDRAKKWGGGVAWKFGRKFPESEVDFAEKISNIPPAERLGKTIFVRLQRADMLASIIAQEGFGSSAAARLRYGALQSGLKAVAVKAKEIGASIHMPRIGTGASGGDWGVVKEIIEDELIRAGLAVMVYDLPPRREQLELF